MSKHERKSWNEYFMDIAYMSRQRSTCARRKVGAVLTKFNRIISTGYNGSPSGFKNCMNLDNCIRQQKGIPSGSEPDLTMAVHAEVNCIYNAAMLGISTLDSVLYCTNFPCSHCLKACIQSGIKKIYWAEPYDDKFSHEISEKSSIEFIQLIRKD